MNENAAYWVWLQSALGISARVDDVLGAFDTARALFESSDYEKRISGVLSARQIARLEKTPLSAGEAILRSCRELGQSVVTPEDDLYPDTLRTLFDMPTALYVQGDLSCLHDTLCIAVVGARHASAHSLEIAQLLAHDLARAGALVVSGCAIGVDSAAHRGALRAGGKTVGVLGCGIDAHYLMDSASMRADIAAHGALVTEYPPGTSALPRHFPMRNRLISALSSGVLVIEAGEKSGSLITAQCAAEQGKDVFAVPGDITGKQYIGANRLIRDGAKPVFSARDVLQEYTWVYDDLHLEDLADRLHLPREEVQPSVPESGGKPAERKKPKPYAAPQAGPRSPVKPEPATALSPDAQTVYDAMGAQALYTDDLVRATKLGPNRVFTALTELEIYGLIQMIQGKRYQIRSAEDTDPQD